MTFKLSADLVASHLFPTDAADFRAAVNKAHKASQDARQKEIAAQGSLSSSAHHRIQLWEYLHGLHLPISSDHKLVHVIADQTKLTVAQIHDEQKRRADKLSLATA